MRTKVVICTAVCTLSWGLSFAVMKVLLDYIEPMQVLSLRWLLAAIIFSIMTALGKIRIDIHSPYLKYALLAGLMEPCIYAVLEIYGIQMMSASLTSIFIATIPSVALIFGAFLFHRKVRKLNAIGIVIAFAGVFIATVFAPGFSVSSSMLGILIMTAAVVSAVFYTFASAKASEEIDAKAITFIMTAMAAVCFNIISLLQGNGVSTYTVCFSSWQVACGILFLGICCSIFGYVAMNRLLALIDTATANSLTGNLTTVIGVIGGIIIAGDQWGAYTIIGMLLTIAGVWLSSRTI